MFRNSILTTKRKSLNKPSRFIWQMSYSLASWRSCSGCRKGLLENFVISQYISLTFVIHIQKYNTGDLRCRFSFRLWLYKAHYNQMVFRYFCLPTYLLLAKRYNIFKNCKIGCSCFFLFLCMFYSVKNIFSFLNVGNQRKTFTDGVQIKWQSHSQYTKHLFSGLL